MLDVLHSTTASFDKAIPVLKLAIALRGPNCRLRSLSITGPLDGTPVTLLIAALPRSLRSLTFAPLGLGPDLAHLLSVFDHPDNQLTSLVVGSTPDLLALSPFLRSPNCRLTYMTSQTFSSSSEAALLA